MQIRTYCSANNHSNALQKSGNANEEMITLLIGGREYLLFKGDDFSVEEWQRKMLMQYRDIDLILPPINIDEIVGYKQSTSSPSESGVSNKSFKSDAKEPCKFCQPPAEFLAMDNYCCRCGRDLRTA